MTADPSPEASRDRARGAPRPPGRSSRPLHALLLLPPVLVLVVVGLLTPTEALFPHQGDVELYLRRGEAFAAGQVPYVDFPFEYPPLALVPMVVPYLLSPVGPPDLGTYKWLFLAWQAGLLVGLGLALRHTAVLGRLDLGAGAVAARLTLLTIAAALPLAWRYDLFPAVLAALAVLAGLHGRAATAGALVAGGALAKLFPIVVLPAVGIRWLATGDASRLTRLGLATVLATAVAFAPFALAAGPAALDFVGYQTGRGLQIESLGGGLTLLAGALGGRPVDLVHEFAAVHVGGPFAAAWLALMPVLTVAGFGAAALVALHVARAWGPGVPGAAIVSLAAAWILALLVTSKVLSVQYVVWLVPFAALLPRGQLWLAAAICGLSMAVHPASYERLIAQDLGPILLLNLRNGLLVGLFAWVLADLAGRRGRQAGSRVGAGG